MNHSCPVCAIGFLAQQEETISIDYNNKKLPVRRLTDLCSSCGTSMVSPVQLRLNSRAIQRAKNVVDGLLVGSEIRTFRLKYRLEQSEAARLFGGGPTAFAKYEVDEIAHNLSMDRLLRLCMDQPSLIISLATKYGIELRRETLTEILGSTIKLAEEITERVKAIMRHRSEGAQSPSTAKILRVSLNSDLGLSRAGCNATASVSTKTEISTGSDSDFSANKLAA